MTPGKNGSHRRAPGPTPGPAGVGAGAQTRVFRRRRATAALVALVAIAGAVAACNAVSDAGAGKHPTTSRGTPSTEQSTTTTTLPSSFDVGIHTFYWDDKDSGAVTVTPSGTTPGRLLTTEVRYPTLDGSAGSETTNAKPSATGGPYPVIVFAHGFDQMPVNYKEMLDAWVAAGFVVVSPIFPDENATAIGAVGGPGTSAAIRLESDVTNEPGDIAYVLSQLSALGGEPWGSNLKGVLDLSDIALAGQSDGANVVAALAFDSAYSSDYAALPSVPKAVLILSGQDWSDTYKAGPASPAVLQVQSDADGCVPASTAADLYALIEPGLKTKWFLTLLGATHLAPYEGIAPWAGIVSSTTTTFLELELGWRSKGLTPADVTKAGKVPGESEITNGLPVIPEAKTVGDCFSPLP